jgi:hypothetical protein
MLGSGGTGSPFFFSTVVVVTGIVGSVESVVASSDGSVDSVGVVSKVVSSGVMVDPVGSSAGAAHATRITRGKTMTARRAISCCTPGGDHLVAAVLLIGRAEEGLVVSAGVVHEHTVVMSENDS